MVIKKNIVLFGPPGAGKGTQAKKLADLLSIPHISTGEMFRDHSNNQTAVGKKIEQYTNHGNLVPDHITIAMVEERLYKSDIIHGFLLDGFPRSIPQAIALDRILDKIDTELHYVINIEISDKIIHKRLKHRAHLENRIDDTTPEIIQQRIDTYKNQSKPCLDYYKNKNILHTILGNGSIENVFSGIKNIFFQIHEVGASHMP